MRALLLAPGVTGWKEERLGDEEVRSRGTGVPPLDEDSNGYPWNPLGQGVGRAKSKGKFFVWISGLF